MKRMYVILIAVISFTAMTVFSAEIYSKRQNLRFMPIIQNSFDPFIGSSPTNQADTNILLTVPPVKCGRIPWNDPIITNWLEQYNVGNGGPGISKYTFSGWISGFNKGWKLKVIITTNQDWPQPITLDDNTGKFDGVVYLDDASRVTTPIKITLSNSSGII